MLFKAQSKCWLSKVYVVQLKRGEMEVNRIQEIQLEIHRLLIEACAIADEENKIAESDIRTCYLNKAGNSGANAVLECNLTVLEK